MSESGFCNYCGSNPCTCLALEKVYKSYMLPGVISLAMAVEKSLLEWRERNEIRTPD